MLCQLSNVCKLLLFGTGKRIDAGTIGMDTQMAWRLSVRRGGGCRTLDPQTQHRPRSRSNQIVWLCRSRAFTPVRESKPRGFADVLTLQFTALQENSVIPRKNEVFQRSFRDRPPRIALLLALHQFAPRA